MKPKPGWCAHCNRECSDRFGVEVYPNRPDLAEDLFWVCPVCDARVGSHPDGRPLGTAANAELRNARQHVHQKLDPIWKDAFLLPNYESARRNPDEKERRKALAIIKRTARVRTYAYLAEQMGMTKEECHVAMMDIHQCRIAYRAVMRISYEDVRTWWKGKAK